MQSLFLKIFLWFWLAIGLILLAGAVVVVSTETDPLGSRWRATVGTVMTSYAQIAADIFQREGSAGLDRYLSELERNSKLQGALFDAQGRTLSTRAVPVGAQELFARVAQEQKNETDFYVTRTIGAWRVQNNYVFVCELPGGLLSPLRGAVDNKIRLLRFFTFLFMAGLVCYGLARYLTAPIRKLRTATQRFASGDLQTRVGAAMGKRRDELADLGRDFDLMAERIEGLMQSQQRLVGDISHELRSPLARVNVALELARQKSGADAASSLDRIEKETARLNELIGQLLTLSKLESGMQKSAPEEINFSMLVQDVVADADYEARNKNRVVRIVSLDDCKISGSAELLRQAVENVVRNAIRYTPEKSEVEISLQQRDNQIALRVRDHGAGVPEERLQDIFRPFFRISESRDRQSGGVGLGLSITARAVQLHRGAIKAVNAPDGGLIVEILLPQRI